MQREDSKINQKIPKVLLLVAGGWISFFNQGQGLQVALAGIGINAELVFAGTKPSDISHTPDLTGYRDYIVIAIGSWQDYNRLIAPAISAGCRVLPWLMSDGDVDNDVAKKLNENFPWFLTTSNYCSSVFIKYGVQPDKVRVLYEAVDEDVWAPSSNEQMDNFLDYLSIDEADQIAMPVSFNLRKIKTDKVPIMLTIGGDATSKGAIEIISALHKLDQNIPWIWVIKTMPGNSFKSSLVQYLELKDLAPRVKFIVGEFSSKFLVQLVNLCDIYIATSRGEGFGLPLAEAQMCGKMVITHNSTATKEIIIPDKTGLLVNSHAVMPPDNKEILLADIDDLAIKLKLALTDTNLRQSLSDKSRDVAVSRFGKRVIANQLVSYIEDYLQ